MKKKLVPGAIILLMVVLSLLQAYDFVGGGKRSFEEATIYVSYESGCYEKSIEIELSTNIQSAIIRYTIDGQKPLTSSTKYDDVVCLSIPEGNEIAVYPLNIGLFIDGVCIKTLSKFYILENDGLNPYELPILCISTDDENLYDYNTGILVEGITHDNNPLTSWGDSNGNYFKRGGEWVKPSKLFFVSENNECLIDVTNVGLAVSGGSSRSYDVKSLKLVAGDEYNTKNIEYGGFADEPIPVTLFKQIKLHSGSQDRVQTNIRNDLLSVLAKKSHYDGYIPTNRCVVYLNDDYYGVFSIKPSKCKSYIADRFGLESSDKVNYYKCSENGFMEDEELASLVKSDLNDEENRRRLEEKIDMEDWLLYYAIQIISNNIDWPDNNLAVWRYEGEYQEGNKYSDGRFRTILFDVDLTWCTEAWRQELFGNNVFDSIMNNEKSGEGSYFDDILQSDYYRGRFWAIVYELLYTSYSIESLEDAFDTEFSKIEVASSYIEGEDGVLNREAWVDAVRNCAFENRNVILEKINYYFGETESLNVKYLCSYQSSLTL